MENLESGKIEVAPFHFQPISDAEYQLLRGYPAEMYTRRGDAVGWRNFRRTTGECIGEEKICISACGGGIVQWHEKLYGFPRVVVHGIDSLCVVARTEDLDHMMRQAVKANRVLKLKSVLIYEAEDLALPSDESAKMTSRSFEKPFIAVSVVPGTNSVHEASGDKYDVDSAIKFLKEEMDSGTTFDFEKSVKTAIFTLEHLFCKKFMAEEIRVFYVKNHSGRVVGSTGCSEEANEFPPRRERSIIDHLAVLNKSCSGKSSSRRRLIVINKTCSGGSSSRRRLIVINKTRSGGSPGRKRGLDVIYKARIRRRL